MKELKNTLALILAALPALAASPVNAQIQLNHRTSQYSLTFSNDAFANANDHASLSQDITGHSGNSLVQSFNVPSNAKNPTGVGSGGVTVSAVTLVPGSVTYTVTSNGTPGRSLVGVDLPAGTNFSQSNIVLSGTSLEFAGGGFGGVDDNNRYDVQAMINGDWSSLGTGPDQTQFVGLNPLWTVDKNFAFDGTSTVFAAHINNYLNDGNHDAGLDFVLHGRAPSTVPEPNSLVVFGVGLLTLLALRHRRQCGR